MAIGPFQLLSLFRITGAWQTYQSVRKKKEMARKKNV